MHFKLKLPTAATLFLALAQTALSVPIFSSGSMPYGLNNYDDYKAEADESRVFRDIGITPKEIREIQEFEEEFDLTLLDDVLDMISESAREL
ncbi:uncharacterized protein H6S33_010019 [Morchella sextelata]|uniref:uncharacterized protein n=1 Tax=Morchella sextelata TaxID=1174677 RepID=UPI001D045E74|nr:uncharacterized protein H6S33_010019 [Morchella sextelata]KAH0611967.1 hypothetical protein H6S33_010019 [Morchella sextelata]